MALHLKKVFVEVPILPIRHEVILIQVKAIKIRNQFYFATNTFAMNVNPVLPK